MNTGKPSHAAQASGAPSGAPKVITLTPETSPSALIRDLVELSGESGASEFFLIPKPASGAADKQGSSPEGGSADSAMSVRIKAGAPFAVIKIVTQADSAPPAQKAAEANAKNKGWTALMRAAGDGDLETVKALLGAGAEVNAKDNDGQTALMYAAGSGRLEAVKVVKVLLAAGAEVNAKDNYGQTALMRAAGNGRLETVKALLGAGAEVNAKDNNGRTALMRAEKYDRTDVARLLSRS